jgi:hypothetical protein
MKRTLGPSWTAEQITAGERFKQGWLDFFDRPGAEAPAMLSEFIAETGSRTAIRAKHESRLLAYPNVVGVSEGTRIRRGKPTDEAVIVVLVSQKVPRNRLTKVSLLPSHVEGVPVDVVEVGSIEALAPNRKRAAAAQGRRRGRAS